MNHSLLCFGDIAVLEMVMRVMVKCIMGSS